MVALQMTYQSVNIQVGSGLFHLMEYRGADRKIHNVGISSLFTTVELLICRPLCDGCLTDDISICKYSSWFRAIPLMEYRAADRKIHNVGKKGGSKP